MNLSIHSTKGRLGSREGFALPAVIFALFVMSSVALAALVTSNDEQRSSRAIRESIDAFYAAEAGLDAIAAEWGTQLYDTLMPAPGDSVIIASRTLAGGCSYSALIHRVDGGTGPMFAVTTQGRGSGGFSGSRTLNTLLVPGGIQLPTQALVIGGNLKINGNADFSGGCADVHANGPIDLGGDVVAEGVSSTGNVTVGGSLRDSSGNPVTPETGVDPVTLPELDPMDYCGAADFILRNDGTITNVALGQTKNEKGWGWKFDDGNNGWKADDSGITGGTMCVEGNLQVGIDLGSSSNPMPMTILAGGSVIINGDPYLTPAHPDGIGIMAAGDLKLNGSPSGGVENFTGLYYAGSQCGLGGSPSLSGQLICLDKPNPPGSQDWMDENIVNGDANIEFDCSGVSLGGGSGGIRRLSQRAFGSPM